MTTATVLTPAPVHSGVRLLTIADVAALPSRLPSGEVRYELHHGRLIVMAPPGAGHSHRQARITRFLMTEGEERGYGQAFVEVAVILGRYPDHLVAPDAAFLTTGQLPPRVSPEGYLVTVPELIVEVRSKNDTQPEIDTKVND